MRLSKEKARQLNAMVWRERIRRWAVAIAIVVAIAGVLTYYLVQQVEHADRTVDVRVRDGTVVGIKQHSRGRGAGIVEVRLEDGRDVEAFSMLRLDPGMGAHVVINEARHASGRLTYDITRMAE